MENPDAIAQFIMQKDDNYSDKKIEAIRDLMMCARLTREGSLQMESEIRFYEGQQELNRMIIKLENEELIRTNAIKILHRMISETEIPCWEKTKDMKAYQEIINEYSHYLEILSKS